MAEAAVLATLGWVASPLVTRLINKAHDLLGTSIDERMKRLEATVIPRLSLAIEKAENSPNRHKLQAWLQRLKGAYYDAEEAIDLLEYNLLEQKVMADRKELIGKARVLWRRLALNMKLRGLIDKIIKIAKEANEFRDLLEAPPENATSSNPYRETIAQPLGKIFSREKDEADVVGLLTVEPLNSEPRPRTIAIVGRSGIGKTALAQCVYKYMHEQSKQVEGQKHFDRVLWVHAPRKFEAANVVEKTLHNIHATYGVVSDNFNPCGSINDLGTRMNRMLASKKFLLILDDFWCDAEDDKKQWEMFISCFTDHLPGSQILLTTQSARAAEQTSLAGQPPVKIYLLKELEEDPFFELFMHYAWPSDCSIQREEFESIGREIADKLKRDPGAAKLVGDQLRKKCDIRHWMEIAGKDWSRDEENMKPRIWSYQQLSVHLQRCFAFCCLYPKGYGFSPEHLIRFWMAEGFIKPIDMEDRMEDIGKTYLSELVCRFFLEKYVSDGVIFYRLHDLLHDLAERIQGDDFLRIDYTNRTNDLERTRQRLSQSENIRHISLPTSTIVEIKDEICLVKNLRTLVFVGKKGPIPKEVLQKILRNSKKLQVLFIPSGGDELPNSIGNLKHLRYLWFGGCTPLKELPDSICKLYLLQTLRLPSCHSQPKEFYRLISLRHIHICMEEDKVSHVGSLTSLQFLEENKVSHVGSLTSLQSLEKFNVRKESGHELHQLENLNQLRGTLCITGLDNVMSVDDAVKAQMESKVHLEKLELHFCSKKREAHIDFELLCALQPHPHIRGLTIEGFRGNRFPDWLLGQNRTLKYLTELELAECSEVQKISSIGESHTYLTSLILRHIPQLSYFSEKDLKEKEERKELILEASKKITEYMKLLYEQELGKPQEEAARRFLQLVKKRWEVASKICTQSSQCENTSPEMEKIDPQNNGYSTNELLEAADTCMRWHIETMLNQNAESELILPSSLTSLTIAECSITNDALSTCIKRLVSLSELHLVEIHTITSLPPEEALDSLKNLRYLCIQQCYLLSSLGGISALTSLKNLNIEGCLNLNSSNKLPSSLHRIHFGECAYIDEILAQSDLPKLHNLSVGEFPNIGPNCERRPGVLNVGCLHRLKEITFGCRAHDRYVKGLNLLTSLSKLEVHDKINLVSPTDKCSIPIKRIIAYHNPLYLKEMLSAQTLSSIECLEIRNFEGEGMCDEMFQSLTSLNCLHFTNCNNITHLPVQLENLPSLDIMYLNYCPNLHELASIPKNVHHLHITGCPTLSKKLSNYDSKKVKGKGNERATCVKLPKQGQTISGPSHQTQQVDTSQLSPNLQRSLRRLFPRFLRKPSIKTILGPSQPTQQADTLQPNPHFTPSTNQSSATTVQGHIGIENIPQDSLEPSSDVNEAGPSGTANEDVEPLIPGQSVPGPSDPTQQADTSQPNPHFTPNTNQSSTSTAQKQNGIETAPLDSPDQHGPPQHIHRSDDSPKPPSDANTVDVQLKAQFDEAGPSGTANEDVEDDEETRPRRLLRRTP